LRASVLPDEGNKPGTTLAWGTAATEIFGAAEIDAMPGTQCELPDVS